MNRILHVYPQLNCGGTEMVLYNLIKFGNHQVFQYEILVQKAGEQDDRFKALGCKIHEIDASSRKLYRQQLAQFFSEGHFQAVHVHIHREMPIILKLAREAGIPHCIAHSHNARLDIPRYFWPLLFFLHRKYEKYATDLFGCSLLALQWRFPLRWRRGRVIYNGIDLNKFRFDMDKRQTYRSMLGVQEQVKVVMTVGRCTDEKNHHFILDRAKEMVQENMLFVIIGEGPLLPELTKRIAQEKITNVRFLGKKQDIPFWLCAADAFIFPSRYEGLGIAAIEAQANGLPVLSTDSIPEEADMQLGLFVRIPLHDTTRWNRALQETSVHEDIRTEKSKAACDSHYNIRKVTEAVESIYLS